MTSERLAFTLPFATYNRTKNGRGIFHGESGDDTIFTATKNNYINGREGNDTIKAGAGDDIIDGGKGNDDDDVLRGGADNDTLIGGSGADTFWVQQGMNFIKDFRAPRKIGH